MFQEFFQLFLQPIFVAVKLSLTPCQRLVVIVGMVIVLVLFLVHRRVERLKGLMKGIPSPRCYPFIGSALELNLPNDEIGKMPQKYTKLYGPRYFLQLGPNCHLSLTDGEDIEKVLSSSVHITKGEIYDLILPWLGEGLLTSKQSKWHTRRKMLTPSFHFRILEDFMPIINEQSDILVEILRNEFSGGQVGDIYPYVTRCALDIISETAMGNKLNAQRDRDTPYVKAVYRMCGFLQYRMVRPWLRLEFLWRLSHMGRKEEKCLKILHEFTSRAIKERKETLASEPSKGKTENKEVGNDDIDANHFYWKGKRRLAFLDLLIEAQKIPENNLTDKDLREEVDTFMFEGHDTTAASINWTLFLLGTYEQHQVKVHEELDEIFGSVDDTTGNRNRPITTKDLSQMKYLELCIKESLRLYPSVTLISRWLTTDCVLDENTTIPAGVQVCVFAAVVHRNEKVYPQPELFLPERFLPENCVSRNPYSYIPFSAGPRNCIGQKFALMEEKVVLANILRNFRIEAAQKLQDVVVMAEVISRPRDGLKVRLLPR